MSQVTAVVLSVFVSAVVNFLLSSVIHMATPWHKRDYAAVPDEDRLMQAVRPFGLRPGDYMMPRPSSMEEMRSPAFVEKANLGPRVVMTVLPGGPMSIGKNLLGWFVYLLAVAAMVALLDMIVVPPGARHHDVFHVTVIAAFLGYAAALWQMTVWYSRSIGTTIRSTVDGAIYALTTAAVFSYFW